MGLVACRDCGILLCKTVHLASASFGQIFWNSDIFVPQTGDFVNLQSTRKFMKTCEINITFFFRL